MKKILNQLKGVIGEKALAALLSYLLTEARIRKTVKVLLDYAEEAARGTKTKIDDKAIAKIRQALKI